MNKRFILIVYDISNDRRRSKLHNLLLDYGTPVQYSAFECILTPRDLSRLKEAAERIIRKRKDNVRGLREQDRILAPGGDHQITAETDSGGLIRGSRGSGGFRRSSEIGDLQRQWHVCHLWRQKTERLWMREGFMLCPEMNKGGKMTELLKKLHWKLNFPQGAGEN